CFKLIGYPPDFGKRNNSSNTNQNNQNFNKRLISNNNSTGSSSTFSDEQISKLLSLIKENSLGDKGIGVQANMTGVNQHLTYTDEKLVNTIDISYLGTKVSHPNGTEALITNVGNLNLTNFLTLYDVLVVPEYSVTLVSVHKDDNSLNAHDHSDGSHSSQPSSPTIDHYENDLGHSQGSIGSVSETERAATSDHNTTLSEDDITVDDATEHNNWSLFQLDINNAILYGEFDETVYMDLPEGYYSPDDKRSDYSLFTKSEKGNFLALLVYVDDIIVTRNNVDEVEKFKEFLRTKFQIKDLDKLKYFLGIEVLETDLGLCLSQRKYCLDLLSKYGLLACKPSVTPLEQNLVISNEPTEVDKVLDNVTEYQRLIGKLIYPTHTMPEISIQSISNPGKGVHTARQPKASLEAFVDADWAKCLATRKSVTRFCVKLNAFDLLERVRKQILFLVLLIKQIQSNASVTSEVNWNLRS
ncbi:ribonuclease H-like domain-containing protein, partial [Tanacetum coccineum]